MTGQYVQPVAYTKIVFIGQSPNRKQMQPSIAFQREIYKGIHSKTQGTVQEPELIAVERSGYLGTEG